jgi:hypothetical protein
MTIKIMYIRSIKSERPIGCIATVQNETANGKQLTIGWSYCSWNNTDVFSRKSARNIACGRASKNNTISVSMLENDTAHTLRERVLKEAANPKNKLPSGFRRVCKQMLEDDSREPAETINSIPQTGFSKIKYH